MTNYYINSQYNFIRMLISDRASNSVSKEIYNVLGDLSIAFQNIESTLSLFDEETWFSINHDGMIELLFTLGSDEEVQNELGMIAFIQDYTDALYDIYVRALS